MAYTVIKKIGKGGQGDCYLVKDTRTGSKVVAKKVDDFDMHGKIPREVNILQYILPPHPNILNLLDYVYHPESRSHRASLTMYTEFCSGDTLHELIPRKGEFVEEDFIWHVFAQVAEALALLHHGYDHYARDPYTPSRHWTRIIHRDIKPDNIFLRTPITRHGRYPDIVLADFGFATTNPYTETIPVAQFAPPEMPLCSHKGDVWSLGAVIHQLATGKLPLRDVPRGYTKDEWYHMRESKKVYTLHKRYSSDLVRMLDECLCSDRDRRVDSLTLFEMLKKRG